LKGVAISPNMPSEARKEAASTHSTCGTGATVMSRPASNGPAGCSAVLLVAADPPDAGAIPPALGDALEIRIERELYGAGATQLLERLRQVSNRVSSVMLIAHNPGIQDLALVLAAGGPAPAGLQEKFPTGALATVEFGIERWRDLDHGTATATGLVTPRSLESGPGA
jgi:hypothetical protein